MLGVWVDRNLALEVRVLRCGILKVSNEPLVTDVMLLTLPRLVEECDPNHDDDSVDDTERTSCKVIVLDVIINSFHNHGNTKNDTDNGHRNEPASVMDEPGEVEAEFFTVVVLDEVEWLHVLQEASQEHASTQTPLVFLPRDGD